MISPSLGRDQPPFRVLIADDVDEIASRVLHKIAQTFRTSKLTEAELIGYLQKDGGYDALIVRSGTKVSAAAIAAAGDRLRIIARAGVGVDNVDVRAASERGIFVVNSPQGNTVAAAEHTIGLMFALARKVAEADAVVKAGKWDRARFMGRQLQGKTIAIIGLGQVGSHVARIASAIGMELTAFDPYANATKAQALGCNLCSSLDEALKTADVITLHVPLAESTKGLLNVTTLKSVKSTAMIINCSRGGVVDEDALVEALRKGDLGGAALDVFETEGKTLPEKLRTCPNILLTPHLGASTLEAQANVALDVANQVRTTLLGGLPDSAVNLVGFGSLDPSWRPAVDCCYCLGKVAMQVLEHPLEEVILSLEGDPFASGDPTDPLLLAAINGALSVHAASKVNFVNVRQIAEKHAVTSVLTKRHTAKRPALRVTLRSSTGKTVEVAGHPVEYNESHAVLLREFCGCEVYLILSNSNSMVTPPKCRPISPLRLSSTSTLQSCSRDRNLCVSIAVDENRSPNLQHSRSTISAGSPSYVLPRLSSNLLTHYLYTLHDDAPGILGKICAILGSESINIGNCHLGRRMELLLSPRKSEGITVDTVTATFQAVALFQIDSTIPTTIVNEISSLPGVTECGNFIL